MPLNYQKGTKDYSKDSIYWTYKLAGILVDAHYAKFAKDLEQTQKHINSLMVKNIVTTDQAVAAETDAVQRTMLMTKGSAKAAQLAQHEMERLTAKLITDSANLSPLNFTTDSNL